jgi:putative PIN family toxin of toxin-antitoxin system
MSNLRGVLDTNVVLSAWRSTSAARAPGQLMVRLRTGEWTLLYSTDILEEYAEKLLTLGATREQVVEHVALLTALGEEVAIEFFHLRHYPSDADDIAFLLCAWNGAASHLVSYDRHLLELAAFYESVFRICRPAEMLAAFSP